MHKSILLIAALTAFAANSFFCRFALANDAIDPGSFTWLRLMSGAATLWLISAFRGQMSYDFIRDKASWWAGGALFGYAVSFSFAYTELTTGTGALILFGTVQMALIAFHLMSGHRLKIGESIGIGLSLTGFIVLMLPSAKTPDLGSAALMLVSGICWAAFTLLGRNTPNAAQSITHGFLVASLMALMFSPALLSLESITAQGAMWALLSGVFASGLGYIVWYQVLKQLSMLQASVSQLAVPVIAFIAGSLLLGEMLTLNAVMSSLLILGGIALIFTVRFRG
ncbi:DMT family transporter [Vibrio neptunius]|uniref:DMT family transporter n=1 Tax=Vibrio neptunius TaxID=170651 RepID=A0ABS3A369_9VIBR|nr:DMT family transporter [Vibrio neptunius]MBN3492826.1 DMT family transporter [Vibrio neptunius]MBN3515455.1 DMT family transporter [Vibrio neptunius]MBN3549359.1 DMT family transporter [Vibrio neptunius]MBN3577628.1 DMT family transporter [Vibrio neptunius]MCH9871292.1 DMT family transporter [Vibrio neptunius]